MPRKQLDNEEIKGKHKEALKIAEKLNELLASVFPTENTGQIPVPKLTLSGRQSEELSHRVTRSDSILHTSSLNNQVNLCDFPPLRRKMSAFGAL